ncbi:hypothetical protein ACOMHN_058125 [Nucella lapillus]
MVTTGMTNDSALVVTTEKPYEEFDEVKTALLIDRIYLPILVSVGVVCNFLCFVTFVFTSLRTTSTCVYMAAIAVLDSSILIIAFCVLISRYLGNTIFYLHSNWACGLHYFLFYFTIHLDVLVLLAMTVDRFIVVKFPLKAQGWCTPKSAIRVITGLGIFSFALNFQIFFNRRLVPSGNPNDPLICWYPAGEIENFMEKIYTIIDASIYSFIPFLSLLTLNLLIIRQLKQSRKFSKQFTESRVVKTVTKGNNTDEFTSKKMESNTDRTSASTKKSMTSTNINVMFLLVSFAFLVLTSPIVIVLLYGRHSWRPQTNAEKARFRLVLVFVDNIMYSNHTVNFLLYCISGRRFREELKRLLSRFCFRA